MMNPFQMLQMFKNTNNPMAVVKQIANNNPQMQGLSPAFENERKK